jgi:hypothetical protein
LHDGPRRRGGWRALDAADRGADPVATVTVPATQEAWATFLTGHFVGCFLAILPVMLFRRQIEDRELYVLFAVTELATLRAEISGPHTG